jgi:hypothetical protein
MQSAKRNFNRTINTVIIGLSFYVLFGLIFSTRTDSFTRLSSDLNENGIGIRAAFIVFFILLQFFKKNYSASKALVLIVISFFVVIISGSRTAFIISCILLSGAIISIGYNKPIKYKLASLFLFLAIVLIINSVLDNYIIGERLSSTFGQIRGTNRETGTLLDYAGDRGFQYYEAAPIIKEHLLTGIGLHNYVNFSKFNYVFHSEYLIQICECGVIGFLFFLLFYTGIFKYFFNLNRTGQLNNRSVFIITTSAIISLILLAFVTRICYYSFYFCFLAIIYSMEPETDESDEGNVLY